MILSKQLAVGSVYNAWRPNGWELARENCTPSRWHSMECGVLNMEYWGTQWVHSRSRKISKLFIVLAHEMSGNSYESKKKNIHLYVRSWANISTIVQVQSERDNYKWDEIDMVKEPNVVSWTAFHTCNLFAIFYQQPNCVSQPGQSHIIFLPHNIRHVAF